MNTVKKLSAVLLASALSLLSVVGAAADAAAAAAAPATDEAQVAPAATSEEEQAAPAVASHEGTVTDVRKSDAVADMYYVSIDEDGSPFTFVITGKSYIEGVASAADITADGETTLAGYYDPSMVTVMIYPPQYSATAVVVNPDGRIKVDMFDSTLTSSDRTLVLKPDGETEILLPDGSPYGGEITRHLLLVHTTIVTRSMPGQTVPAKIVVLDAGVPVAAQYTVDGVAVNAPGYYINTDGVVMLPLRALAEALGYTVRWEEATESVMLNNVVSLRVGSNEYAYARMAPITLDAAPELVGDRTYVPLSLFGQVLHCNINADFVQGRIVMTRSTSADTN